MRSEVQPAQNNESAADVVVDRLSPIQTQLFAVHNNNDIGLYPNSTKAVKDDRKYTLMTNCCSLRLHLNTISKRMRMERVLSWEFYLQFRSKRFMNFHLQEPSLRVVGGICLQLLDRGDILYFVPTNILS